MRAPHHPTIEQRGIATACVVRQWRSNSGATVASLGRVTIEDAPDRKDRRRNARKKERRVLPPLDAQRLSELALSYVARYATSRAKLRDYLKRKLRERGWAEAEDGATDAGAESHITTIVEQMAELRYVDDAGFARARIRTSLARGHGARRSRQALHAAGIDAAEAGAAMDEVADETALLDAAWRYAERRRLGPFARAALTDPKDKQRAIAAFLRAGHSFDTVRRLLALPPGAPRSALDADG